MTTAEVAALQTTGYNPWDIYQSNAELKQALDMVGGGYFSPDAPGRFRPLFDQLIHQDHFLLLADYASYIACQKRADELYRDPGEWAKRAILNVAGMGKFSSDRTIREYADRIWGITSMEGK
jgi:starch phosphorylase